MTHLDSHHLPQTARHDADITEEIIDALGTLLSFAERFKDNTSITGLKETAEAITLLSTAGFFASIEEVERNDEDGVHRGTFGG